MSLLVLIIEIMTIRTIAKSSEKIVKTLVNAETAYRERTQLLNN